MKRLILVLAAFFVFFLESIVFSQFAWKGVSLPLTLVFGLSVAVAGDEWDSLILGLLTGFFSDIYTNHLFGINMLLNLYLFLGINYGKQYLRHEKNWLMVIVMSLSAFLRFSLLFLINRIGGMKEAFERVPVLTLMVLMLGIVILPLTRQIIKYRWKKVR